MKRGALEDGFDPNKYFAMQNENYKKIHSSKYEVSRLAKLSDLVTKGETPLWRGFSYQSVGIPFLKGKDIKEGKLHFDNITYIEEHVHNGMKRSILNDNFLLLTMAGTLGDVAFFKKEYPESNINQDIAKIRLDTSKISYEYAVIFFETNLAKSQIAILSNGGTRGHLNFDKIKSFKIIIPPLKIQAQIVEKFNQAYELKRQKEAEAKALLESIDGYLLKKLGIELPTANEPKKFFYTRFKDVQGKRFDANAFKEDRINSIQSLNNCIFPIEKLKFVTKFIKNIVTKNHQQLPYLGLENIESNTGFYIETTEKESFSSAFHFSKNHVIFPKLRPYLNKVTKTNFEGLCSTEFHVLQPHKVTSDFLAIFLRSSLVINQTKCLMSGNTLPRLQTEDIESLLIPIPDLNTQFEIASYVTETFYKANQLKSEAKEAIETAKAEVERMILGES